MDNKIMLGTLENITNGSLCNLWGLEVAACNDDSYLIIPKDDRRDQRTLMLLNPKDLSEIANYKLPSLPDKKLILGSVRCNVKSGDLVIGRHFWTGHGSYGLSEWDYGFLATKLSSLVQGEFPNWLNQSMGNRRIAAFEIAQKEGTRLYFVNQSNLWSCPLGESVEPVQHGVQADGLTTNGQVLYLQWSDYSNFQNPWKIFVYDFNNNQRLEDKTEISISRNIRHQHGYLFVETATPKELPKRRKSDPAVGVERREIDVFKEQLEDRKLTYEGTFMIPGKFNLPRPCAQLYGTMYTEMAYCPINHTLFAVAGGELFKGQLRSR